ncbi:MAG: terpene cyclase/mutase family protein [Nitrososphaerota archaeon]|nr:terpene cyclase/mutase family protein [Nitrososphaerota archaeon]
MSQKDTVVAWLLEESQPAVRYLALTELLGVPEGGSEARAARAAIAARGWAKEILDRQKPGGFWEEGRSLYHPKYTATNWMLLVLSDLGLTKADPKVDKACRLWIERLAAKDGGFAGSSEGGANRGHLCTTGNAARALVKFGYVDHPGVRSAFEWFVENQSELGGWSCFNYGDGARGRNLDSWEPLSAFAVYPRQKWTRGMKGAVEKGAEFFLQRELHRQGERYEPWYRFHYPVHYYYDLLVGLDFITALGYTGDRRTDYAVSVLKEKRMLDGRWLLDSVNPDPDSPQGGWNRAHPKQAAVPFSLEVAGKPSKMITLRALTVLRRLAEGRARGSA